MCGVKEEREEGWKMTVGACNGGDKEKNQLDLLGWLKYLCWAWMGYLSMFLIPLWDQRCISCLSAWPCKYNLSFAQGDGGRSMLHAGTGSVPELRRLLHDT